MKKRISVKSLPTNLRYLLLEAQKRGYMISRIPAVLESHRNVYQIVHNNKTMLVVGVNDYPDTSYCGTFITSYKLLTYNLLRTKGIHMPRTYHFLSVRDAQTLWKKKFKTNPVVLKPDDSALGFDVYINLKTAKEIQRAASVILRKHSREGLIQEYKQGKDLRIQAIGGKLFAACIRIPAHVIGNGKSSINKLIRVKNKVKRKFSVHNVIKVDKETKALLKKQKLSLSSIPKQGQLVKLKKSANIGQGGDAVDVTNDIHKSFYNMIQTLAETFGLKIFAADFIIKDETKPVNSAYLLEINAPCMWAHHHFVEGQKRNVAAAILDAYFYPNEFNPNSLKYLIPKI